MIMDRSIVGRLNFSDQGMPVPPEYLCRAESLFAETEWFWDVDKDKAYVFESHAVAETHARQHREAGVKFCFPLVLENPETARPEPEPTPARPPRNVVRMPKLTPQQVFEMNERRHLA